jgi:mannitol/fructose-specific phosphotransferase system IIA component (Ntr-type)
MPATLPTTTLAEFTSANLILPELQTRTTVGVVNELNFVLQMHENLPEHLFATVGDLNHALLTSVWLDGGMAIAQVRTAALPHTRFALGRAKQPLPWRASSLTPIYFVVLVVEPSDKPVEYHRVVDALNTLAHHTEVLKLMRAAANAGEILAILSDVSFHRT